MASSTDALCSSSGAHAIQLIQQSSRKLVHLQPAVLADRDPEPLHQMRVSMRRLRTCLRQFAPALQLPGSVTDRRIAKVARRLGMARDLDVLRDRLQQVLIPRLPEPEAQAMRPVLKQLRRERRLAYEQLVTVLQSGSYLELLAKLQRWLKSPRLTPLGEEPLGDWLVEWQAPLVVSLFRHPGWFVVELEGDMEAVHDLRKQCKTARYALENLAPVTGTRCRSWARRFQRFQDLLGELNDLQVLQKAIDDQLPGRLVDGLPRLHALLQVNAHLCWRQWRLEAEAVQSLEQRHRLLQALLSEAAAQQLRADLDRSLISS
jgi:CHAD domain-containing protein